MITKIVSIAVLVAVGLTAVSGRAADDSITTAVFSHVTNGYEREKLPDGTFRPEYYAISNGGYTAGIGRDPSIDNVPFPTIAGVVAQHLAGKNYFMAKDSSSADLLLVVRWGLTVPFNNSTFRNRIDQLSIAANAMKTSAVSGGSQRGPDGIQSDGEAVAQSTASEFDGELLQMQIANSMRDKANEHNAIMLGYIDEINSRNDQRRFAGGGTAFDDLITDIENERYYVIITAYDFRAALKDKNKKVLWSTRVSIQAQGNRFDERLVTMVANASKQFGKESGRLIRQFEQSPKVKLGELQFLGVVPDSAAGKRVEKSN